MSKGAAHDPFKEHGDHHERSVLEHALRRRRLLDTVGLELLPKSGASLLASLPMGPLRLARVTALALNFTFVLSVVHGACLSYSVSQSGWGGRQIIS